MIEDFIAGLPSISLHEVERRAELQTRTDRKYLVSAAALGTALANVQEPLSSLEIDGQRWFRYESMYFDTDAYDTYRLAATRRPSRFKVRTRTYVDSGTTMLEVKTKDRRGQTHKHRQPYEAGNGSVLSQVRGHADEFEASARYASQLHPVLESSYERSTLVLASVGVRITIDRHYRATEPAGRSARLHDELIVETKTAGRPCAVDHALWRSGQRPVKLSKYATALAALHPELPSNRWHRSLQRLTLSTNETAPAVQTPLP